MAVLHEGPVQQPGGDEVRGRDAARPEVRIAELRLDVGCDLWEQRDRRRCGRPARIGRGVRRAYLAGVLAAARAGLGVALLATVGRTPEGLVRRTDLPEVPPIPLSVTSRRGLRPALAEGAATAVRRVLEAPSAVPA